MASKSTGRKRIARILVLSLAVSMLFSGKKAVMAEDGSSSDENMLSAEYAIEDAPGQVNEYIFPEDVEEGLTETDSTAVYEAEEPIPSSGEYDPEIAPGAEEIIPCLETVSDGDEALSAGNVPEITTETAEKTAETYGPEIQEREYETIQQETVLQVNGTDLESYAVDGLAEWTGTERVENLQAKSSPEGSQITWEPVSGAEGYLIGAIQNGNPYRQIGYTSKSSYTDTEASLTEYSYYWVFPYRKVDGKIVRGGISANYVYGIRQLPKPADVKAVGRTEAVELSWKAVEGADGYVIKARRGNGSVDIIANVTETVYTDREAPTDAVSYYWVYAYKQAGSSRRPGEISGYVYAKANVRRPEPQQFPTLASLGLTAYSAALDGKLDPVLNTMISELAEAGIYFSELSMVDKAYFISVYIGTHYYYNDGSYTAESMLDTGYGTCFAYADLAYCMIRKIGLASAWLTVPGRNVDHEEHMYGSYHRTLVILIDGQYYDLDASYANLMYASGFGSFYGLELISDSYANYLIGNSDTYTSFH